MNFTKMVDEDIIAIFIYLKSTKPVNNTISMPLKPGKM